MPDFTHYQMTIEVLSPVHIGDGKELVQDMDYIVRGNQTWVVDQEQVFLSKFSETTDDKLLGLSLPDLLTPQDYKDNSLFRYKMDGIPTNRPIKSHIKDVYGNVYLPGSTIKGMLRTIFLWGWFTAKKQAPYSIRLDKSRFKAGQPIERQILGDKPNEDFFRALHVSDTNPVDLNSLRVVSANIYPTGGRGRSGVNVDVEALRENVSFETWMSVEEYGFESEEARKRLKWDGKRVWIDRLATIGKALAGRRIVEEIDYYQRHQSPARILNFYNSLVQQHEQLEKGQFFAQIGWGAGWNSKTLNDLLKKDQQSFGQLVRTYKLTRFAQNFRDGDEFPNSRHVIQQQSEPIRPMGWVKVTIS